MKCFNVKYQVFAYTFNYYFLINCTKLVYLLKTRNTTFKVVDDVLYEFLSKTKCILIAKLC